MGVSPFELIPQHRLARSPSAGDAAVLLEQAKPGLYTAPGQPLDAGRALASEGAQHYRIGTSFEIGWSLQLNLEGEPSEYATSVPEHGVMLRGQLRF